jgi:hypothetical protein
MIATEVLNLTGATNSWSSCSVYLTEVTAWFIKTYLHLNNLAIV